MMKTFSIGGIHPSDKKISKDCKIEVLPVPSKVYISVAQHLGAPATPIVKAGEQVKVGQVIAEPAGFISAYVHSSVSGTVKSVGPRKDLAGNNVIHIEIDVEGDEWAEGIDLSEDIVKNGGLIITEYITETNNKYENIKRFIDRDRLQALFSKAVILVASNSQGNGDSGSRHAMNKAKEYGKEQFVMLDQQDKGNPLFQLNEEYII